MGAHSRSTFFSRYGEGIWRALGACMAGHVRDSDFADFAAVATVPRTAWKLPEMDVLTVRKELVQSAVKFQFGVALAPVCGFRWQKSRCPKRMRHIVTNGAEETTSSEELRNQCAILDAEFAKTLRRHCLAWPAPLAILQRSGRATVGFLVMVPEPDRPCP